LTKLNQILAIEKGTKSRVYGEITQLHKAAQKPDLFNGFTKTYEPKDDADDKLPAEGQRVQFTVPDVLRTTSRLTTELMDVVAKKDWTNCVAKADVTMDGKVLIEGAPVSYLLFLEKQLSDLHALASSLPVLDEAQTWAKDESSGLNKAQPTQTHRTKKVAEVITLVQPTPEHPGQAQLIQKDVIAGFWTQIKMSGAIGKIAKAELVERVEKLANAVKQAREAANMADVVATPKVGDAIFGYLMGA